VVGFALDPPAFAVGVVVDASVGGSVEASHIPRLDSPFDSARRQVPEGSSAVVVFSDAGGIRSMYKMLVGTADMFVHYRLDPAAEGELECALGPASAAAPSGLGRDDRAGSRGA
jgi:hypothetical protein